MVSARPSPARSAYKQQSLVLAEVKAFDRAGLRHVEATRVTNLSGAVHMEANQRLQVRQGIRLCARAVGFVAGFRALRTWCVWVALNKLCTQVALQGAAAPTVSASPSTQLHSPLVPQPEPGAEAEAAALRALAALRLRAKKDVLPARVADGLFIGGAGAARNLKALRKRGISHIVNAAPAVPCHFHDNPEGAFEYLALPLFDDPEAGGCTWQGLDAVPGGGCWLEGRWVLTGGAPVPVMVHCCAREQCTCGRLLTHPGTVLPPARPLQTCCRTSRRPMPSLPARAPAAAPSSCTATPGRVAPPPWSSRTSCSRRAWG